MIQAARSGKQNILEGSLASGTSKETEIFLTGVARSSLGELCQDYRDFLRTHKYQEWTAQHRFALRSRELMRIPDATYATFQKGIENPRPEISANVIVGLIKVTRYLLGRQITALEKAFLREGGLKERMMRARLEQRRKSSGGNRTA
jgi:four helix bundle suffix protein